MSRSSCWRRRRASSAPRTVWRCRAARTLALAGRPGTATGLVSYFEALREKTGFTVLWVGRMNDQTLASIRMHLDDASFAEAWEQGRALTADEAVALALDSLA